MKKLFLTLLLMFVLITPIFSQTYKLDSLTAGDSISIVSTSGEYHYCYIFINNLSEENADTITAKVRTIAGTYTTVNLFNLFLRTYDTVAVVPIGTSYLFLVEYNFLNYLKLTSINTDTTRRTLFEVNWRGKY
jgi:hypothetical protein